MKNPNYKRESRFPFVQRFLTGLIIALGLSLTAFEWTTFTIDPKDREPEIDSVYFDDDLILPPITYRKEKIQELKPKKPTPSFVVVETTTPEIKEAPEDESKKDDTPIDEKTRIVDIPEPSHYGGEEILVDENLIHTTVEIFAHYDNCAGLRGEEMQACSVLEISNRVKRLFKISPQMQEIGGRQAVLMTFVIDKDGSVTDVEMLQTQNKHIAKAAAEAIKKLPPMNPASQQGRAVKLQVKIPIQVRIQ